MKDPGIQEYKDAVWAYLMEHCDIMESGALFVKFHTDGRIHFERRIRSRVKGYHRTDPVAREKQISDTRQKHLEMKKEKHDRFVARSQFKRGVSFWKRVGNLLRVFF